VAGIRDKDGRVEFTRPLLLRSSEFKSLAEKRLVAALTRAESASAGF
jgi:hypothetical protein